MAALLIACGLQAAEVRLTPEQRVAPAASQQKGIQVAVHGNGSLLAAWRDASSAVDVAFNGAVVRDAHVPRTSMGPALAAGADTFLVVWAERDDANGSSVHARRISIDGASLDAVPLALCQGTNWPSGLLFDGTAYLVTCTGRDLPGDRFTTRIVRISESGSVTDELPPRIVSDEVRPLLVHGRLLLAGANFAFHSTPTVYPYARVQVYGLNDGVPSEEFVAADMSWAAAAGPDRVIVLISGPGGPLVLAQTSFSQTTIRKPYRLSQLAQVQAWPAGIVWNGSEYVLVWLQRLDGELRLRGIRLNRSGDPIDEVPLEISGPGADGAPSLVVTATGVAIAYGRAEGAETHAYLRILERLPSAPRRPSVRR